VTVRVDAFTKLTLSLRVLGRRANGYHEIDGLVVSVTEPHDSLSIESASSTSLTVTGPFAAGVPVDERNLAWRAADAAARPLAIRLHKGIPHGAGLGGGSADAAAVLSAATVLSAADDAGGIDAGAIDAVAAALGADVPFCVHGGAARMRGAGETLEPATVPPLAVVIATPPFTCFTADVYAAWDALGGPAGRAVDVDIDGIPLLVNDLEPAAVHVEPRLAAYRASVEQAAQAPAILAGSGSSYALLFEHHTDAERARADLADSIEGSVFVGSTADAGVVLQP
jgi:4-diphosphocytidyl-2-C-methyl-D-erythritol kinase